MIRTVVIIALVSHGMQGNQQISSCILIVGPPINIKDSMDSQDPWLALAVKKAPVSGDLIHNYGLRVCLSDGGS